MNITNTISGLKQQPSRFASLDLARISVANHEKKIMVIMLGDDGKYWVVLPVDAAKLEAAGYEYAD